MELVEEQLQQQNAKNKNNVVIDSHGDRRLHTSSLVKTEDFPQGEDDVLSNGRGIKLRRAGTTRKPIYEMRLFSFLAPKAVVQGIRKSVRYGLDAMNFTRTRRSTLLRPPPGQERKSSFIPEDGALDSIADDSFTGSDAGSKVEIGKQRHGNRGSIQLLGNNKVHSSPV